MRLLTIGLLAFLVGCSGDSNSDPGTDTPVDCNTLDEAECGAETTCMPITARPVVSAQTCLGDEAFVACVAAEDAACNNDLVVASVTDEGECWYQSQICTPPGWTIVETGECAEAVSYEPCVESGGVGECEVDADCVNELGFLDGNNAKCVDDGSPARCSECAEDVDCPTGHFCKDKTYCIPGDAYEFCGWRTASGADLAATLVGDWIVFAFDTDQGTHAFVRFGDEGTYTSASIGGPCDDEPECFDAQGAPDCAASGSGTWSIDSNGSLVIDDEVRPQIEVSNNALKFGRFGQTWTYRAVDCAGSCLDQL